MQRISRAPVLSATFRRVSFWITARSARTWDTENGSLRSLRTLQHLGQAPALRAAHRPALDHANRVALLGVVRLVVRVQLQRRAQDLVVAAMPPDHVDLDRDGLVALRRRDDALAHARAAGAVLRRV